MSATDIEMMALLEILSEVCADLFLDQNGKTYAVISHGGHAKNLAVDSQAFDDLVLRVAVRRSGIAPRPGVIKLLKRTLRGTAVEVRTLHQRVARKDDEGLLIDLNRPDGAAAEVNSDGWSIVNPSSPPFVQGATAGELPIPEEGGNLHELDQFIPTDSFIDLLLLKLWLVISFILDIARPIAVLTGVAGSGKTETSRVLQCFVDPQTVPGRHMPKTERDLVITLKSSYVPLIDNVRSISPHQGDILAQAVTDFGYVVRRLFTDETPHVHTFRRTAIITGLDFPTSAGDLLSRCLLIEFTGSEKLRAMEQWMPQFQALRPRIFGAILTTLSRAMRLRPALEPVTEIEHRLADWMEWAVAVGLALGNPRDQVIASLAEMQHRQRLHSIAAQPIARGIMELMRLSSEWRGTPTMLLGTLEPIAKKMALHRDPGWPRGVEAMSKAVRGAAPELEAVGIMVTWGQRGKYRERYFEITKLDTARCKTLFRAIS